MCRKFLSTCLVALSLAGAGRLDGAHNCFAQYDNGCASDCGSCDCEICDAGCCGDDCCDTCGYEGDCDYCTYYGHGHGHHRIGDCPCVDNCCLCGHHGWDGKRRISYQQQKDLFYNYYAQPGPFYNTPSQMYVSPLPVPARVGHTYTTYQPFMPHEYTYRHQRAYYTYNRGSGWTRTNVRYGTCGNQCHRWCSAWGYPMSNNIWAVHNDFYHPGRRF